MAISPSIPSARANAATPRTNVACAHCALPVPAGLVAPDGDSFCCEGCRSVFEILHSCGLEQYYRLRAAAESESRPAATSGRRYEEYDDAAFQSLYVRTLPSGLATTELFLPAVHCAACVWLVEKLPRLAPGVVDATLNLPRALVRVTWNPTETSLSRVARALERIGYPPHPAREAGTRAARTAEERRFLSRIGVAGACAGNAMLLALALYSGMFESLAADHASLFRWVSMFITVLALAWPGNLFFRGAWVAIRTRTPHLDLPIAIGLGVGLIAGCVATIRGVGEIYFDSLTVLVFLLLIGRWIQYRQQRGASDALELLFSLTPTSARLVEDAGVREIAIESVAPGMRLEVRAGDSIPVDGLVSEGASQVDESLLTGESQPVNVAIGTAVHAGAVNLSGRLVVVTRAAGAETRVGKLMQLVEECARRRAPIVRAADRIAGWFVATVLGLASATLLFWLPSGLSTAADYASALLIVTCPCALGLATPLAITVAIGRAARRRILIKGGDALENLARPGTIVLDKTGTLTAGRPSLVEWRGDPSLIPAVAALEAHSSHPLARALAQAGEFQSPKRERAGQTSPHQNRDHQPAGQAASDQNPPRQWAAQPANDPLPLHIENVSQTTGGGITGDVNGVRLTAGSAAFVSAPDFDVPDWVAREESELAACGLTPVRVAVARRVAALAGIGDAIRSDAAASLDALRRAGWHIRILSGDHADVVRRVAADLNVQPDDAIGAATPETKLARIREWMQTGPVVMVGDGVNDAAALSAATVGIAVHGGAEASLAAADAYLNRPGLAPIAELTRAARGVMRTIRIGMTVSIFYNAVAGTLAMVGVINPLIAAVLMPLSSFTVIAIAFAQRSFPRTRCGAPDRLPAKYTGGNEPRPIAGAYNPASAPSRT